jgi:hypothetical protein
LVQPNPDGTFPSDSYDNEYEDLEGYQYEVTVGNNQHAELQHAKYCGPDLAQAEEKYAEWVATMDGRTGRHPHGASVKLTKTWEGKHAETGASEVLKEQT